MRLPVFAKKQMKNALLSFARDYFLQKQRGQRERAKIGMGVGRGLSFYKLTPL